MIRSVSLIRKLIVSGIRQITTAAGPPAGPQGAGRAIPATSNETIGPAQRRKISCQAGGSDSSGLNQVWSLKISSAVLTKNAIPAVSMMSRSQSELSVVTQDGIAIRMNASGISM